MINLCDEFCSTNKVHYNQSLPNNDLPSVNVAKVN